MSAKSGFEYERDLNH